MITEAIKSGMEVLRLGWDTPYRFTASLITVSGVATLFGWIDASTPLSSVGQIGAYLAIPESTEVMSSISGWLSARKDVVVGVATILWFLGILTNVSWVPGRYTLPNAGRGAPTALLMLCLVWEAAPDQLPTLFIIAGLLAVFTFIRSWWLRDEDLRETLLVSVLNFLVSALYILLPVAWLLGRSSPATT